MTGKISKQNLAVLELNVSRKAMRTLMKGEGVVFYPENLNRLMDDVRAALTPSLDAEGKQGDMASRASRGGTAQEPKSDEGAGH